MTKIAGASDTSSQPDDGPRPIPGNPHVTRTRPATPEQRGGDRVVWTRVGGVQGGPLDLLTARIGRRHYAPHIHDQYAIGVTVDGLETMRYRGERVYSGAGSIVVVEPGEAHTGGPAHADGFAYLCVYPDPELLGAVMTEDAEPSSALPHFREPIIGDLRLGEEFRLAHRALRLGEDPLEGESRLLGVLGALVRRHAGPRPGPGRTAADPGRRRGVDARRIACAVSERLSDELTAPPTLAEVAADLEMSRYQLLRAFRNAVGMPPYAWLAQHRVTRARALLDAGHRPAEAASLDRKSVV